MKLIQTELTKDLVIAGIMRVADFPFFPAIAAHFSKQLDYLVISFDSYSYYDNYNFGETDGGAPYDGVKHCSINGFTWCDLIHTVDFLSPGCTVDAYKSTSPGTDYEEPLRRLDHVKPDYVLLLDTDDAFQYGGPWEEDLDAFVGGDYDIMVMKAKCVTDDGRGWPDTYSYPVCPHMRAFRWTPTSTFIDSGGFCEIVDPSTNDHPKAHKKYRAKNHLIHLPFFTREMQRERECMFGPLKVEQQRDAYLNDEDRIDTPL